LTQVVHAGAPIESAKAVIVMVHGRNAGPENILDLLPVLERPAFAAFAPAAPGGTWYPLSFMADRSANEPGISNGLRAIESIVQNLIETGFSASKIMLLGFSQGACLCAEYSARHPRPYGGVIVLSGGLIGPPGTKWHDLTGTLDGTPVFLGCSDPDPHIPAARVLESEKVFSGMGANVTRKLYPGMGHVVNADEIRHVQKVMDTILSAS
jgi:predicted esterase